MLHCMGRKMAILFIATLISNRAHATGSTQEIVDSFEGPKLSDLWRTDRFVPGRITFQSKIVRAGKQALKVGLKKNDKFDPGNKESLPNERDELCEARELESLENGFYEYKFSEWIPKDFPIADVRLNIAQWKQRCDQKT